MASIEELQFEIEKIKKRNARVEADKAWETSMTRKMAIAVLTYFVVATFFYIANLPNPPVNAIVPAMAFILSTLTVSVLKKIWLNKYYKK